MSDLDIAGISLIRRWYRGYEHYAGICYRTYTGNWFKKKKAIGAKKSNILGQFLAEASVLLLSMGGILGVASGIGLAESISKFSATPGSNSAFRQRSEPLPFP